MVRKLKKTLTTDEHGLKGFSLIKAIGPEAPLAMMLKLVSSVLPNDALNVETQHCCVSQKAKSEVLNLWNF